MAFSSLFAVNLTLVSSTGFADKHLFSSYSCIPVSSLQCGKQKREFPLPSVGSIPYQPINVDYLEDEFSGHGVSFEDLGGGCIAKLRTENGSTATVMLPSGLITSYKARMWHGGAVELLQTSVLEGPDCGPVIQGGVSLAFNFKSDGESSCSPSSWALHDVRGDSQDSVQVEMKATDAMDMVEVRHILHLKEDTLSSELVVSNSRSSSIQMMGSLIGHLTVSTPEATFACGLEGSDFISRPMFSSNFSIVPPNLSVKNANGSAELWGLLFGWSERNQKHGNKLNGKRSKSEIEMEGEEGDNYKNLTEEMSRIYTSAPRNFTVIDRGRRNSVVVGREGFDELYMFSPGSDQESYGMYSYICVGQSAMLKPVILNPGDVWRGWQHLHNPNL